MPGFDRFYGAVLESIPFREEQEIRVLDLGAGTGLLSAMVAGKFPRSRVTLVDLSVEMLRVARRRFSGERGRFEFRTMDYARKPLPRTEGLRSRRVGALGPPPHARRQEGAVRESPPLARCRRVLRQRGPDLGRDARGGGALQGVVAAAGARGGVSEEDLAAALSRMRADRNATLEAQLGWLGEAGFEEVGCRYKDHRFAVYDGRKGYGISENGKDADG